MREAQGEAVDKALSVVRGRDICKIGQWWHWYHYLYCGNVS